MKKPLQVKVLEWWFGLLAGVASLLLLLLVYGALQDGKVDLAGLILLLAAGAFLGRSPN